MGIISSLQPVPAFLLHVRPVLTISNTSEISTFGATDEDVTPACHTEGFKFGTCPFNWLRCHSRSTVQRVHVDETDLFRFISELIDWFVLLTPLCLMLVCLNIQIDQNIPTVSSNQSNPVHEYPDCRDGTSEASLLVSPLVVAGIVIGLVLFLSCVTIIVGSMRKDSRLRNPHLRSSYAPDSFSYGGSVGELRSSCMEEFPTTFHFDSYIETLSQVNVMYPDSPPHYDECVGPGATQIYVPTDDPPPYSLTDPCRRDQFHPTNSCLEAQQLPTGASWASASGSSQYPIRLQDWSSHPVASHSATPLEEAPPYEVVMGEQSQPLPLIPMDLLKLTAEESGSQHHVPHTIL